MANDDLKEARDILLGNGFDEAEADKLLAAADKEIAAYLDDYRKKLTAKTGV